MLRMRSDATVDFRAEPCRYSAERFAVETPATFQAADQLRIRADGACGSKFIISYNATALGFLARMCKKSGAT